MLSSLEKYCQTCRELHEYSVQSVAVCGSLSQTFAERIELIDEFLRNPGAELGIVIRSDVGESRPSSRQCPP